MKKAILETSRQGGHLGYLLSAYIFDSLSAAGREDVESHLAHCAECRAELEALRRTLGEVEVALDEGGKEYVFEERRRQRVLAFARRSRLHPEPTSIFASWKVKALVAMLMVAVLVRVMTPPLLRSRAYRPMPTSLAASSSKASAEAEEIYRRTDAPASAPDPAPQAAWKSESKPETTINYLKARPPEAPAPERSAGLSAAASDEARIAPRRYKYEVPAAGADTPAAVPEKPVGGKESGRIAKDFDGSVTPAPDTNAKKESAASVADPGANKDLSVGGRFRSINGPGEGEVRLSAPPSPAAPGAAPKKGSTRDFVIINKENDSSGRYAAPPKSELLLPQDESNKRVPAGTDATPEQPSQSHRQVPGLGKVEGQTEVEIRKSRESLIAAGSVEFRDASKDGVLEYAGKIPASRGMLERIAGVEDDAIGFTLEATKRKELHKEVEELSKLETRLARLEPVNEIKSIDSLTIKREDEGLKRDAAQQQAAQAEGRAPGSAGNDGTLKYARSWQDVSESSIENGNAINKRSEGSAVGGDTNAGDNLAANLDNLSRNIGPPVLSPEILDKAALGDHFETINLDKPDTQSAGEKRRRLPPELGTVGYAAVPSLMNPGNNRSSDTERLLRGYRYFRAQNPRLSLQDYLRRPAPVPPIARGDDGLDEDEYIQRHATRPFVDCARDKFSTFSMDVDTASYTLSRSRLKQGELPDPEAVRVEEFVNYFKQPYDVTGDDAFGVFAEAAPSPFSAPLEPVAGKSAEGILSIQNATTFLKVGIKSRQPRPNERKPAMLTFVIDTSGSMTKGDRLELVRGALKGLLAQLNPEDAICIVGFSDQAELLLPRTQARQSQRILDAINAMTPHGATNVESGLNMAYRVADEAFAPDAVNRVILCSDGVANVGAKGPDEILNLVKVFAGRGIDLYTVGFGQGQYNDKMMVQLADNGNGSAHFVDSQAEAVKIFSEQLPPHLNVLARDAKVQVEFNPDVVERYRLLGYEKRKIADKDFRNDAIDAAEIAHDTLVTALYEIIRKPAGQGPLGKVFLRWKDAGHRHLPVVERNYPLSEGIVAAGVRDASPQLRFLACVARFAELLRDSRWTRDSSFGEVLTQLNQLPEEFKARDDWKEVQELVTRAQALTLRKWMQELRR